MIIEKFNYKIPIIWLDTNVIIDIAQAKNGLIEEKNIKERALKIYNTVYKLVREKKIICVEGEQRNEYGNRIFLTKECDNILTELTLGLKLQNVLITKQFQIQEMMKVYLKKTKEFELREIDIFDNEPIENFNRSSSTRFIIAVRESINDKQRDENIKNRNSISKSCEKIRINNIKNEKTYSQQLRDEYASNIKVVTDFLEKMIVKAKNKTLRIDDILLKRTLDPLEWWKYETGKKFDLEGLKKFYLSEEFKNIPHIKIFSKMYARLLTDKNRNIKVSDEMDIAQISVLLPYCDYIITDAELNDRIKHLKFDEKYNVKTFSLKCFEQFISELDKL